MNSRKLFYNKGPFVNDTEKFLESKNYKSPENLLKTEQIYFSQGDKKLKSLANYFCSARNSIEYKNKFANSYVKNYLNKIKRPMWQEFYNKPIAEKITQINGEITKFNQTVNNTPSTYINIVQKPDKYDVKIGKVLIKTPPDLNKEYIENINFLIDNPAHMLTLFVLIESDENHIAPLQILKFELELRVIIENLYDNNFQVIIDIIRQLYTVPPDYDLTQLNKTNSGDFCFGLSMFEKYETDITFGYNRLDSLLRCNNFNDFYLQILQDYFGPSIDKIGNRAFIDGLMANQNVNYKYENTTDYYLIFSDIDSSMGNLRLGDLIYFSYFFTKENVGNNIKEKIMGSILYGFAHEVGHEVDSCFNGEKKWPRSQELKGTVPNNVDVPDINTYVTDSQIESAADLFSYKLVFVLLDQISTSETIKRDLVKYLLFMTCGDRTNFGHADTMIRSNYIRYLPEYDKYLPQDNSYYKKYLKYKSKYTELKLKLNK